MLIFFQDQLFRKKTPHTKDGQTVWTKNRRLDLDQYCFNGCQQKTLAEKEGVVFGCDNLGSVFVCLFVYFPALRPRQQLR